MADGGLRGSTRELPPGTMALPDKDSGQMLIVRRRVEVAGERLKDAQPSFQNGGAIVNFRFDTAGGKQFATTTSNNVGQRLAVVLDGTVISSPSIRSRLVTRQVKSRTVCCR